MAFRRMDVARLMSTPGVYVGVNVRSDELVSGPASPSELCSFWALISCLRAASDLKVGSVMAKLTLCRESRNRQLRMERATGERWRPCHVMYRISTGKRQSAVRARLLGGCGDLSTSSCTNTSTGRLEFLSIARLPLKVNLLRI